MNIVLLLAPIQAFFLASLLLAKPGKSFADKVLIAWLLGIGAHTLIYFLHFQYGPLAPLVLNLNAAFPFLQGPFLLAWVAALTGMRQRFGGIDLLHLLPFAAFVAYIGLSFGFDSLSLAAGGHTRNIDIYSASGLFAMALLVSVPAYIAWSLLIMRRAHRALQGPAESGRFRWIWGLVAGLAAIWIVAMLAAVLNQRQVVQPHLVFWAVTVVVYVLGYLGLTRTSVFTARELETLQAELQPKYLKSGLRPDAARALYERLLAFVDGERAFLDPDISLGALAEQLDASTNHVSQVINAFEERNFHDFVNARRIDEACQRLHADPTSNLLELAMNVGFNSKSSFNRAFRKFAGKTPSQFIKTL